MRPIFVEGLQQKHNLRHTLRCVRSTYCIKNSIQTSSLCSEARRDSTGGDPVTVFPILHSPAPSMSKIEAHPELDFAFGQGSSEAYGLAGGQIGCPLHIKWRSKSSANDIIRADIYRSVR